MSIITYIHKRCYNGRDNTSRQISANETYDKSFEDKATLINELHNATAVANIAAPEVTFDAALIEKCAPTEPSAKQLSLIPTDSDKSKLPNALTLCFVRPYETVFVNIAKPEPTVAGLYEIEPVAFHRGGTSVTISGLALKLLQETRF